ncbi:hypothetical protein BJ742DRAFT_398097 [Cladochytrium replicatum]|nr:hypothetical protein BJ742DRAFT_398097 [Cladochytrium replicatum]
MSYIVGWTIHCAAGETLGSPRMASKHIFDRIRSLGASEVFDYNDPEVAAKIKGVASKLLSGIDTGGSFEKVVDSIAADGGQNLSCATLPPRQAPYLGREPSARCTSRAALVNYAEEVGQDH